MHRVSVSDHSGTLPGGTVTVHSSYPGGPAADDSAAWERRLGRIWAQQLRQCHLGPESTVVEIGPGFSAKVGFGLAEVGFQGELILVEPNAPALRWAADAYQRLLPQAAVRSRCQPVPDAGPIEGPVAVLLANHLLDDLLLSAYVQAAESDRIFGAMRPGAGCPERYVEIWLQLIHAPGLLSGIVDRVAAEFASYVAKVQPACLILNDYPGWQHNSSGLGRIHQVSRRTMRDLQRRLERVRPVSARVQCTDSGDMLWLMSVIPDNARWKAKS